jgi:hypothetical protein
MPHLLSSLLPVSLSHRWSAGKKVAIRGDYQKIGEPPVWNLTPRHTQGFMAAGRAAP